MRKTYVFQCLGKPQGGERRHCGHHGDAVVDQPGTEVHSGANQSAGSRHQTRAMAPGQPHLFARGVEGHREAGKHPVLGADGFGLEEEPGFGVHERGGRTVLDGHTLGSAGGARSENDPRIIVQPRSCRIGERFARSIGKPDVQPRTDDCRHFGLPEHQACPFLGIVGVDGHVGGPGHQDAEDSHVELIGSGRDADTDFRTRAQTRCVQGPGKRADGGEKFGVAK